MFKTQYIHVKNGKPNETNTHISFKRKNKKKKTKRDVQNAKYTKQCPDSSITSFLLK